jgi:hypothetical protein
MITYQLTMTKTEVKPITVQVLDLQEGETVASANATHTPPSGSALTITPSVETPYVNMLFGPFAVEGIHYVNVQAVGNATPPSKPEVLYIIEVR